MNISDIAAEIVDLVQVELANKTSVNKINRLVAGILAKIVSNFSDAEEDGSYVVVVTLNQGLPEAVSSNHPALAGALFICTDNMSVADDEESAVVVYDDIIVVGTGEIDTQDDMTVHTRAAHKFERLNN